jgi:hypothetical protein
MANFKPIYLLSILHIIHHKLSVDGLVELGLEYSQIVNLLSYTMAESFVEDTEEGLKLTNQGLEMLEKLNTEIYPSNPQAWILPSEENRIPKLNKFDIYLPKRKEFKE